MALLLALAHIYIRWNLQVIILQIENQIDDYER